MFKYSIGILVVVCLGASCSSGKTDKHQMPHDFSDAAHWSKVFDDPDRDAKQMPRHVVGIMNIEPGMTVVDIGAGTGYFLPYLSNATGDNGVVLALDIEQGLVDHMNRRAEREGLGNVEARLVAPDDPHLKQKSVDRVLIVNTWHHLPDPVQYAERLAAALSPNGRLFIVDFTLESKVGPPKEHRIPPEKLTQILEKANLSATIEEEKLPDQYIVSAHLPR